MIFGLLRGVVPVPFGLSWLSAHFLKPLLIPLQFCDRIAKRGATEAAFPHSNEDHCHKEVQRSGNERYHIPGPFAADRDPGDCPNQSGEVANHAEKSGDEEADQSNGKVRAGLFRLELKKIEPCMAVSGKADQGFTYRVPETP